MKSHYWLFAAIGLAALAPRLAEATPAWCAGAPTDKPRMSDLADAGDPAKVVAAFVAAECQPTPEIEASRAQIEEARQAWGKKLGMVEADWADAAAYAKGGDPATRYDLSTNDLSRATPIDQWVVITQKSTGKNQMDELYAADAFGPALSEVGRLGVIMQCDNAHEVEWAVCQVDVDAFDPAKFAAQLRSDTQHGAALRQHLRYLAFDLAALIKQHGAKVAKAQRDDEGYKQVWDVAAKARNEYAAKLGAGSKLPALALQMESAYEAQSNKLFAGCDAPTYAALSDAASKLPGSQLDGMKDIRDSPSGGFIAKAAPVLMRDPTFHLAAIAVSLCDGRKELALVLGQLLKAAPGARGPREYALGTIKTSKIELDKRGAQLDFPNRTRPYDDRRGGAPASVGGAVTSIKRDGDHLTVGLAPLMIKQTDCVSERETNKIVGVRDSGTIEYERRCDKFATVVRNGQWPPLSVPLVYEKAFKVGNVVSILGGTQNNGDLIAVWPTAKSSHPTWVFGGAVK